MYYSNPMAILVSLCLTCIQDSLAVLPKIAKVPMGRPVCNLGRAADGGRVAGSVVDAGKGRVVGPTLLGADRQGNYRGQLTTQHLKLIVEMLCWVVPPFIETRPD